MASRGSGPWQEQYYGPGCRGAKVSIPFATTKIVVHRAAVPAFQLLLGVLVAHGYRIRRNDTGAYVCRKITGGTRLSNHSYGTAVDVNWNSNPYGKRLITDMPVEMVREAENLRTRRGVVLFRWGGRYSKNKDAMHWEIMATPAEIAEGLGTVRPAPAPVRPPARPPAPVPVKRRYEMVFVFAKSGIVGNADLLAATDAFRNGLAGAALIHDLEIARKVIKMGDQVVAIGGPSVEEIFGPTYRKVGKRTIPGGAGVAVVGIDGAQTRIFALEVARRGWRP